MREPIARSFDLGFARPVEALWSVLSDTPRLNERNGNPKYEVREILAADGRVDILARVRVAGLTIEWEELPANWIVNRWFEQDRRFRNGPFERLTARAVLHPAGAGSRCEYSMTTVPRNLLGRIGSARMMRGYERTLREALAAAERSLAAGEAGQSPPSPLAAPAALRARAEQLAGRIEATPYGHGLAARLAEHVLTAQEVDLWSLRPIALARRWGTAPRRVVELCLQAVREGLLQSRWDLLCPRCRVSKQSVAGVGDLPDGVHCASCNIDFRSDFSRNVELAFSPGPAVRSIEYGHYCRTGPGATPHVKAQITLEPGSRRTVPALLPPGRYRVRTLEAGGEADVDDASGGFPAIRVTGAQIETAGSSPPGEILLSNRGEVRRTVVIEDRSWLDDVLTAERVTTLQAFRDLFSEEILRPGDDVSISNITFMFTDLVGSTSMFAQYGDARAYHVVREHFALLGEVIREHDGSIVKTIGDGIHAAFATPDDALRCAIRMQQSVAEANREFARDGFAIRIGLHNGSSISVTLNGRLDYYGSTVNMAARLEGQGRAGQITMSEQFVSDAAVRSLLEPFSVQRCTVALKGFADPLPVYRIEP